MTTIHNELRGKRILVTGASGFIGSRVVKELLKHEAMVIGVVDVKADLNRIEDVLGNPRLHLIYSSLTNVDYLSNQIRKWGEIELLAHLGLFVPRNQSFGEQAIHEIRMNLLPTVYLMKILGNSLKGICFASSLSVYGKQPLLPAKEDALPAPISAYAVTKLAIEDYLRAYGEANQIPVTILRYAIVYGPGEFSHRAIPNFLNAIAEGNPPRIYGDGSEIRDYVYIDDAIEATVKALALRPSRILNIGSGQSYTTTEIAREVTRLYPTDIEPMMVAKDQPNINLAGDISAAREVLSFSPGTSLEDGLRQEIEWFKRQQHLFARQEEIEASDAAKNKGLLHRLFSYAFLINVTNRILSFLAIIVISPLLAIIALGIKLDSRESPIFAQERVGKDGNKFTAYKFRSMHSNNDDSEYKEYLKQYVIENVPYRFDENGNAIYKVDDSAVTRFGRFLRKTNLDELPQLVNILKGEMSFVGPRPDVPYAVDMYSEWHRQRLLVKPGMTGLWQVRKRKCLSFEDMVRLDIEYINNRSLWLDTKILLLTVGTIIAGDGS
jgi:lipopolysaccharide/colanic/teichoic acid biosynthesis glycosyltransferase/nucleoside-diphosphate-sugar epimerase